MPKVEPGDAVWATNNESLPFTIKWNNRRYELKPNKTTLVPFEAAVSWFGDPRAVNDIKSYSGQDGLVALVPDRASEVRRLRRKYGAVHGDETCFEGSYFDNKHGEPGEPIFIPDVTIADADGEKLWMVVEDPYGNHAETFVGTVSDQAGLLAQLRKQQAQIDLLISQHEGNVGLPTVNENGDLTPPEDDDAIPKLGVK